MSCKVEGVFILKLEKLDDLDKLDEFSLILSFIQFDDDSLSSIMLGKINKWHVMQIGSSKQGP